MKKIHNIALIATILITVMSSCGSKKSPGRIYMPDMTYSRAVETYSLHDSALWTSDINHKGGNQIFYNSIPAAGTIKRGELYPYTLPNDSNGYKMSATIKNPIDSVSKTDLAEAGRLYNINCAICHGEKGTANGPIATAGHVGGVPRRHLARAPCPGSDHAQACGRGVERRPGLLDEAGWARRPG